MPILLSLGTHLAYCLLLFTLPPAVRHGLSGRARLIGTSTGPVGPTEAQQGEGANLRHSHWGTQAIGEDLDGSTGRLVADRRAFCVAANVTKTFGEKGH